MPAPFSTSRTFSTKPGLTHHTTAGRGPLGRRRRCSAGLVAAAVLASLAACSPALDWREVRAPGAAVVLLMPCKPGAQQRELRLAGAPVVLSLQACSAGGQTWALASADVGDPARVAPALQELLAASAGKLNLAVPAGDAFAPPGSTPQPQARRVRLAASAPDGAPLQLESAVFSHGSWVFQATVLGSKADAEAADSFFASLRAQP